MHSKVPGRFTIALIVLAAFVVGVGVSWGGAKLAGLLASSRPAPSSTVSPAPSASATDINDIPVDLYPAITRFMTDDDRASGLESLDIPTLADGTFSIVPGTTEPPGAGSVRWVRIEIEDGLPINAEVATAYVMGILNDPQGWGAHGRVSFGRTEGAADIRVIVASPKRAESMCARPHDAATVVVQPPDVPPGPIGIAATEEPTPSATPSASASPSPSASAEREPSCADRGMIVLSAYKWATGIPVFGDDAKSGHAYMLNHAVGHILGEVDVTCEGKDEVAGIMVNQELDITPCLPNGWPFPTDDQDDG